MKTETLRHKINILLSLMWILSIQDLLLEVWKDDLPLLDVLKEENKKVESLGFSLNMLCRRGMES